MLVKGNYLATGVLEVVDKLQWLKLSAKNATAESPSGFVLQSSGASGAVTDYYFWIDRDANFRMHTSKPTDEDANGSVIAGAANAGASLALDNLASVAVATDIVMTDGVNVAFGTGSDMLLNYDGSDLLLDGAAANDNFSIGATTPLDITIVGDASEVIFDASASTLTVMDSGILAFGDGDDCTLTYDGSTLEMNLVADEMFNIGATTRTDVTFHGGTAGTDLTWDASANTLSFLDDAVLAFGDIDDLYFQFVSAGTLSLLQTVALTGSLCIGVDDHGIDVTFFGDTAGDYIKWDASVDTLIVEDASIGWVGAAVTYDFQISTSSMLITATDASAAKFIFGTAGTHGMDVQFQGQASGDTVTFDAGAGTWTYADINTVYTGADSSGTLLAITGIDTTGNTDTATIVHSGTGAGLKISCSETDSLALELLAKAAQTTSVQWIDGSTADWDGADNVGMLHITQDAAMIHAGATMIYAANSGQNIAAAEGSVARFLDTGTARASTYGVEIGSTNNCALHLTTGAVGASNLLVTPYAAATVSAVRVGAGADWDGADNIGMVHVNSDTALIAAGATNLFVGHATAQPITAAEGFLARFIDTGTARTNAYGVEISVTATTGALNVSSGHVLVADKLTATTGVQSVSQAVEADGTTAIDDGVSHVTVTVANGANDIIQLPTPTPGTVVWLHSGSVAYELRSSAPSTVLINGGTGGAAVESAVLNTDILTRCVCTDATHWICTHFAAAGTESAADAAT